MPPGLSAVLAGLGVEESPGEFTAVEGLVGGSFSGLGGMRRHPVAKVDAAGLSSREVGEWLSRLPVGRDAEFQVAWTAERVGARMSFGTLAAHIGDLWFPAMDDVVCTVAHRSATGSRSGLRYQAIRLAPGLVMFAVPVASRCLTFSSFAASLSSETDSHCCRSPSSCQTARHRPPLSRGGYTVIPRSSSMTSPSPRVAARVWTKVTRLAALGCAAAALRARLAAPGAVVGILWGS